MRSILEYGVSFFKQHLFNYSGNVLLALSGGRSSAAMLRLLLDQHGGALPNNFKVIFNNTGREHEATYEFLRRIQTEWNVDITWLELTNIVNDRTVEFKEVNHTIASRDGAPWAPLLRAKPTYPPRRSARICTLYMKVLPSQQYVRDVLKWDKYTLLYGYRSDEPKRLHNALMRCGKTKTNYVPDAPLLHAGITKSAVLDFFKQAPFDLQIPGNCGNCTFCFLKGEEKLRKVMQIMPGEIDWWINLERQWNEHITSSKFPRQYNILPNGGYKGIKERAEATQAPAETDDNIEDLECDCTD